MRLAAQLPRRERAQERRRRRPAAAKAVPRQGRIFLEPRSVKLTAEAARRRLMSRFYQWRSRAQLAVS
eukprot:4529767-Lingulodinium_polyedra.AAC.1